MNNGLVSMVDKCRQAYDLFERDNEIDRLERQAFISAITTAPELTNFERNLIHKR